MQLIDGNTIEESMIERLTAAVGTLPAKKQVVAFISAGEYPASVSYERKKGMTVGGKRVVVPGSSQIVGRSAALPIHSTPRAFKAAQ